MQHLKAHHRTATRSQIIEFLNSHPELQFKLAEMTNLERAEFVWRKLNPEPFGAGDVPVPPDAIPPDVAVPVDVLDTVISLITDARLDMRDALRLPRDQGLVARAQDSLGNAVAALGSYLPRTAVRKPTPPVGTEAPPCRKCGAHRDANVHLEQYGYATYHRYEE